MEGRRAGPARRRCLQPGRKHHRRKPHGRQDVCTRLRIDVIEFWHHAVAMIRHRTERGLGAIPRIAHHRISPRPMRLARRRQTSGKIFNLAGVGTVAPRLKVTLARVGTLKIDEKRQVKRIQPDNGILPLMSVVMPFAPWGQHQIAFAHRQLLAVDDGEGAFALHDDPNGRWSMHMRRRRLTGKKELHPEIYRGGSLHSPWSSARITEYEHTSLGLFDRGQVASLHKKRPNTVIGPVPRLCQRLWRVMRQHIAHHRPKWRDTSLSKRVAIGLWQFL